jgi:hypothetical protein
MVRRVNSSDPYGARLDPEILRALARTLDTHAEARTELDSVLARVIPAHPESARCRSIIEEKARTDRSIARELRRLADRGQRLTEGFLYFLDPIATEAMEDYSLLRATIEAGYQPAGGPDNTEPRYAGEDLKSALERSATLSFIIVLLSGRLIFGDGELL